LPGGEQVLGGGQDRLAQIGTRGTPGAAGAAGTPGAAGTAGAAGTSGTSGVAGTAGASRAAAGAAAAGSGARSHGWEARLSPRGLPAAGWAGHGSPPYQQTV